MRQVPLFLAACFAGAALAQPSCPQAPAAKYAGPLFDAMAQVESRMAERVLPGMDRAGVSGMALFARAHPKRSGEADVLALKRRYPERFVLGTPKPFDQRGDLSDGFVRRTVSALDSGSYRFVGEILFAHADKAHGEQTMEGERFVAPEGKNVRRMLSTLAQRAVPVMLHWEVYNWQRDWPAFEALYAAFPDTTFIWPHAGFGTAAQVETVLAVRRNVVVTLSKKEMDKLSLADEQLEAELGPAMVDACGAILAEWRQLLEKYPERFMFATDAHKDHRWLKYEQVIERWRSILGQLPDPLAQNVAWRNAERVYAARRP
jgi:predicted TIM-barrel fold metal-dependent hydrolase